MQIGIHRVRGNSCRQMRMVQTYRRLDPGLHERSAGLRHHRLLTRNTDATFCGQGCPQGCAQWSRRPAKFREFFRAGPSSRLRAGNDDNHAALLITLVRWCTGPRSSFGQKVRPKRGVDARVRARTKPRSLSLGEIPVPRPAGNPCLSSSQGRANGRSAARGRCCGA